ncbi:MAG: glycosyltransferase family 2 protein [Chitinophagales bacterium]
MDILAYITAGFLLLRVLVAFFNSITPARLEFGWESTRETISILIPARNEELNIGNLLRDIEHQEYNNFEILVLDDASTDLTSKIVEEYASIDPRCRLITGEELPEDWLGKNWACHQLGLQASGKYFLFLDADVRINGPLFSSAINRMKEKKLALLSLFPGQEMKTIGEWLVVPLMHYLLLSLLPLCFIEWFKHPALSAANGQFMLFDGDQYRKNNWHKQVKNKVTEDIEIMKAVKRERLVGATLLENSFIRCRMYHGFSEGVNGFSKNLLAGFGNSVIGLLIYLYFTFFSYGLLLYAGYWQLAFAMLLIIIFFRSLISAMADQNPLWIVLLHVPQMVVMLYIAARSIAGKFFGTVSWKGRKING